MATRRNLISAVSAGSLLTAASGLVLRGHRARAAEAPSTTPDPVAEATHRGKPRSYIPVHTLNGWTLPYRMKDGVKEFHLVAEEIEHEFAPGCVAKCWGYNGTTPGPTIEAVEGDRVRIYVTNRLQEHTSIHWHGVLLPNGMDGVGGLTQRHIGPGETYAYEFTLRQHGTQMYHPHADELVQMAFGMMGLFIIHPKEGEEIAVDRDYCLLLHNWALHPGTYRPDPSIMTDFDLWTMNSKVFPAIEPVVARTGERVRIRMGNLSMWNHPMHVHGVHFQVTGGDGGRWARSNWRNETTEIVAVGQTRDIEFIAVPGDWAFHCHMVHHTMNAMGHGIPNPIGVNQSGVEKEIRSMLPGYMAMGRSGMAEHAVHVSMGMVDGPANTLAMMSGEGPFGSMEMGGMFTLVKVRDQLSEEEEASPGWYTHPADTVAKRVSTNADFGKPYRRHKPAATQAAEPLSPVQEQRTPEAIMPGAGHGHR